VRRQASYDFWGRQLLSAPGADNPRYAAAVAIVADGLSENSDIITQNDGIKLGWSR